MTTDSRRLADENGYKIKLYGDDDPDPDAEIHWGLIEPLQSNYVQVFMPALSGSGPRWAINRLIASMREEIVKVDAEYFAEAQSLPLDVRVDRADRIQDEVLADVERRFSTPSEASFGYLTTDDGIMTAFNIAFRGRDHFLYASGHDDLQVWMRLETLWALAQEVELEKWPRETSMQELLESMPANDEGEEPELEGIEGDVSERMPSVQASRVGITR